MEGRLSLSGSARGWPATGGDACTKLWKRFRSAAALGEALRAEDGVGAAVRLLEETAAAASRERWDSAPPTPLVAEAARGQVRWAAVAAALAASGAAYHGLCKL